jgi:hypothetical protein
MTFGKAAARDSQIGTTNPEIYRSRAWKSRNRKLQSDMYDVGANQARPKFRPILYCVAKWENRMAINLESVPDSAETAVLTRIAHTLTICARDTHEVGTEHVLDPETLRAYNELLHRVTGSVVNPLSSSPGQSLAVIVEMVHSFGIRHNRVREMDWALQNALQQAMANTAR